MHDELVPTFGQAKQVEPVAWVRLLQQQVQQEVVMGLSTRCPTRTLCHFSDMESELTTKSIAQLDEARTIQEPRQKKFSDFTVRRKEMGGGGGVAP